jgi:RimK family alpha-L-glutamate ligase
MIAIVGGPTKGNVGLVRGLGRLGADVELVPGLAVRERVGTTDVALARLDVLPTLDGVEPGLLELLWLERRGTWVLNRVPALLAAHDKLRTATLLQRAGLPQPGFRHVTRTSELRACELPIVVKPRYGAWGKDVLRCRNADELEACIRILRERSWFHRHGALVQELLPPRGRDLRILVARGTVVGAAERIAARHEWRTNVSLGGTARSVSPAAEACELAVAAVTAVGGDLMGVDLFPTPTGWVLLELNGAVDFDERYSLAGGNLYAAIADALALPVARAASGASATATATPLPSPP